jgi:DNA transposition AAA+ family ATPase
MPADRPPTEEDWHDKGIEVQRAALEALAQDARIERLSRMTQTEAPTPESLQASIENIRRYQAAKSLSNKQLGKMGGLSASVISELLAGKYRGDVAAAVRKLEAAISDALLKRSGPGEAGFVMTRIAREIFSVVKYTSKLSGIGLLTGESGLGKSKALRAVMRMEFPSGALVEINEGCASPMNFCRALLKSMGRENAWHTIRTRADAFNAIAEKLANSHRMIVVDEAENLELQTFNTIRQIHDATGCPIVLAGRPLLVSKIDRTQRDPRIGGSLRGRICVDHNLHLRSGGGRNNGRPLFTEQEVCEILAKYKVRFAGEAGRWLCALANVSANIGGREGGALRYAVKVFEMAATISQGREISLQVVKQASLLLRGGEYGEILAQQVSDQLKQKTA